MLRKKLIALFACVCILTSLATTSVSAIAGATTDPAYPSWVSQGKPWGGSLPEYSVAPSGVANWGGLTVKAAKGPYGTCMRLTANGISNWIFVSYSGYPGNVFTVGTDYVASFDYLRGPYEYYWPNIGLKCSIGGVEHRLLTFDGTDSNKWTNHSWEFKATATTSPTFTFENDHGDIYIDNVIVKEKATGNVVYSFDFEMFPTSQRNWGYNPQRYYETTTYPFYNWPANENIGVVERGTGYAAYIRNTSGYNVFWNSPAIKGNIDSDASYTLSYDYIACDGDGWPNMKLANAIDWKEGWSGVFTDANKGTWQSYTATVTGTQIANGSFGWKFLPGCYVCVDNLKITDSQGKVVAEETFDLVPGLNGPNEFKGGEITITQADSKAKATVDVTNSYYDTRSATFITAIYDGNTLINIDLTTADIVGDPTKVNAVTTISHEMKTAGYTGKTLSAFLWDSVSGMNPLTGAKSVIIE